VQLVTAVTSLSDVNELAVKAAQLAPSTHNSQPWEIRHSDDVVELYDLDKNIRHADPESLYKWISIGAFIENFSICSEYYGYETKVEFQKDKINLVNVKSEQTKTNLIKFISKRYSEKRIFESRELDSKIFDSLSKIPGITFLSKDKNIIKQMAVLQYESSRKYKNNKYFARELSFWMKISSKKTEGMHSKSSGLTKPKLVVGKLALKFSPKILDKMALKYKYLVDCSSAVGFISVSNNDKQQLVKSGRDMERLAIVAASYGLSLTPLAAIVGDASSVNYLKSLQKNTSATPVIFFRISDIKNPVYHTTRKPYKIIVRS
jgi:hypothetical protein